MVLAGWPTAREVGAGRKDVHDGQGSHSGLAQAKREVATPDGWIGALGRSLDQRDDRVSGDHVQGTERVLSTTARVAASSSV